MSVSLPESPWSCSRYCAHLDELLHKGVRVTSATSATNTSSRVQSIQTLSQFEMKSKLVTAYRVSNVAATTCGKGTLLTP